MTTAIQRLLGLYHPASLALLLAGDWALLPLELKLPGMGSALAALAGFAIAPVLTAGIEMGFNGASMPKAIAKGIILGVAVAVPTPVVGTLIDTPLLLAAILGRREASRAAAEPTAPSDDGTPQSQP